jgi:hypothetical protein
MNWPTAHQQQPTFATKSALLRHADGPLTKSVIEGKADFSVARSDFSV